MSLSLSLLLLLLLCYAIRTCPLDMLHREQLEGAVNLVEADQSRPRAELPALGGRHHARQRRSPDRRQAHRHAEQHRSDERVAGSGRVNDRRLVDAGRLDRRQAVRRDDSGP